LIKLSSLQHDNIGAFASLDLTTWDWQPIVSKGTEPRERMGHSCTAYGSLLFLVGGTVGHGCQGGGRDLATTHVYCTETNTWLDHEIKDNPSPALGRRHGAVLVGSKLFCIGGSSPACNEIAVLDIERNEWMSLPAPRGCAPTPRVSLTAHLANGAIFVLGGCTDFGLSKDVHLLFPSRLSIPSWFPTIEEMEAAGKRLEVDPGEDIEDISSPSSLFGIGQAMQFYLNFFLNSGPIDSRSRALLEQLATANNDDEDDSENNDNDDDNVNDDDDEDDDNDGDGNQSHLGVNPS
tara:strand:+ start:1562 stop:2437 length:876 start_codon:yes stop_codon:yes gene_type:complete